MDDICRFCKSFSPTNVGGWCLRLKKTVKRDDYCSHFRIDPKFLKDSGNYSQAAKFLDF